MSTVISRFRGKSGVLEYSLAGLFTGSIYKFGLGPKGMIAGGFFGTFLGTFAGLSIYGLTKFSGVPIDELYNTTQLFFKYKDAKFHQAAKVSDLPCNHNYVLSKNIEIMSTKNLFTDIFRHIWKKQIL